MGALAFVPGLDFETLKWLPGVVNRNEQLATD